MSGERILNQTSKRLIACFTILGYDHVCLWGELFTSVSWVMLLNRMVQYVDFVVIISGHSLIWVFNDLPTSISALLLLFGHSNEMKTINLFFP